MESTTNEVPKLTGGRPCQNTDYKLCVVCQDEAEPLVLHPRLTSYHNLLEGVKERASLHNADCVPVQKRLKDCTAKTLQRENAVWHRTCYSMMTNTVQREGARDRQQHTMSTGSHTPRVNGRRSRRADDVNNVTGSAPPYTRSSTRPLNKNAIPFVSIGADHACEHLNKVIEVHAGLIGMSNNPNARQRFFLAAPELSCLAKEFKDQFHDVGSKAVEHHDLSPSKFKREHGTISRIKDAI